MSLALQAGRVFDHYRLLEKLGEGGMGVVWLAEDTRLGRKVALKFLPPDAARDGVRRQRFEQEARAAAALSHPGIATVHELAETEGQPYIVFEYVPGSTLRKFARSGGLPPGELLDIASDIAEALAAAHNIGVIHRDLKPENVMRTPAGPCKVLDFGLARLTNPGPSDEGDTRSFLTSAGMVVGTAAYMAPEQLEGKEVDFRCDLFAFGTLLYELATGVHPFQAGSAASTIAAIMGGEPMPLTQRNPQQPLELERIVRKCLRKRREERYPSALDLAVDLRNLKRDSGERPSPTAAAVAPVPSSDQESLLRAVFSRVGATPRRWWELHQFLIVFAYAPLAVYLVWQSGQAITEAFASTHGMQTEMKNFGLALFIAFVVLLMATVGIRLYLLCLGAFVPGRLGPEVSKRQAALRGVNFAMGFLLAFLAFGLMRATSDNGGLAAAMAALSLATVFAGAWIEPAIERAAFPAEFAEAAQDPRRMLLRRIAAGQVAYALLLFAPVGTGKVAVDALMQGMGAGFTWARLGMVTYSLIVWVGSMALMISTALLVKEGVSAARTFRRWFAAYLCIDLVGIGGWIWLLTEGHIPAVVGIGLTTILLLLPFGQLRMANQVLLESGELPEDHPVGQSARRRSTVWWWLHQLGSMLATTPLVVLLSWKARPFMSPEVRDVVFLFNVLALGLHWSARFALVSQALGNPADLPAQARRMRRAILWTGWPVVAGLLASAFSVASANVVLAAILAGLAMGGLAHLVFLDPAVERAAFPSAHESDV